MRGILGLPVRGILGHKGVESVPSAAAVSGAVSVPSLKRLDLPRGDTERSHKGEDCVPSAVAAKKRLKGKDCEPTAL